ncbi:MAG: PEP-CTERM sorting domain-containing protein [Pirellulales bacterium]|nr:PEP-CTERM sorting domain-containing protein [Pirellulales bacterium]
MKISTHRVLVLLAAVLLVFGIVQTAAAESVIDYTSCSVIASSEFGRREAVHTIDGTGMNPVEGSYGATHSGYANPNDIAWHTSYDPRGIVEHAWLIIDLGDSYSVDSINIWNYNHEGGIDGETPAGELARGVKEFNLWIRNDGTTGNNAQNSNLAFDSNGWTQIGSTNSLQPGTGFDDYVGQIFALDGNATHVAIDILSNHDGTVVYHGEDPYELFDAYGPLVGLSEVRVYADAVPEPSTLALLILVGCMGLLKRVR